jgi:hypothetical protein
LEPKSPGFPKHVLELSGWSMVKSFENLDFIKTHLLFFLFIIYMLFPSVLSKRVLINTNTIKLLSVPGSTQQKTTQVIYRQSMYAYEQPIVGFCVCFKTTFGNAVLRTDPLDLSEFREFWNICSACDGFSTMRFSFAFKLGLGNDNLTKLEISSPRRAARFCSVAEFIDPYGS